MVEERFLACRSGRGTQGQSWRSGEVDRLLGACRRGESAAFGRLVSLVYADLLRLAHRQLRVHRPTQTLDTVALVHETYLRLLGQSKANWKDRAFFFAIAARVMRQIIVAFARKRNAQKRGNGLRPLALGNNEPAVVAEEAETVIAVNEALDRLGSLDRRLVEVVECRYFAGYSEEETAQVLGVSVRTIQREWKRARAWLKEEVRPAVQPA